MTPHHVTTRSDFPGEAAQAPPPDLPGSSGGRRHRSWRRLAAAAAACLALLLLATASALGGEAKTKTVPLHRLCVKLPASVNIHFYTTNAAERDALLKSGEWESEGIAGYVLPQACAEKPGEIVAFVRFAKGNRPKETGQWSVDHLWTADVQEGLNAEATHGWTRVGVECLIAIRQLPGTVPLHRFHHTFFLNIPPTVYEEYFYTANEEEYFATIQKGAFQYDGVAGYIWTNEVEVGGAGKPAIKPAVKTKSKSATKAPANRTPVSKAPVTP